MMYTLAIGVSIAVAVAMARIIYGIPLLYILAPGYLLALILIRYTSPTFVPVAFDSGTVVTGPMTATFILASGSGSGIWYSGRSPAGWIWFGGYCCSSARSISIITWIYLRREGVEDEDR